MSLSDLFNMKDEFFEELSPNSDSKQAIDEKRSNIEWNLQSGDLSPAGRCAAMFRNELMSDVCFVVGAKQNAYQVKIPAHKFILATASPVFFAMLQGPMAEKGEIEIGDIDPDSFLAMLKYLYTAKLDMDPKSVPSLLYCAKKYLLSELTKASLEYLQANLTEENALFVLNQSILLQETSVIELCLQKIDIPAATILASDEFVDINLETLKSIISRQTLNAPEIKIFEAAWRWAKAECRRQNQDETGPNCRKALNEALFLIRFPAIPQKEFAAGPAKSELLTNDEICDIYFSYTSDTVPESWSPAVPRSLTDYIECQRYTIRSSHFECARQEMLQFKVDTRIFLAGLGIYTGLYARENARIELKCELKLLEKVLQTANTIYKYPGPNEISPIKILFSEPVRIEAKTIYTLSVILPTDMHVNYQLNCLGTTEADSVDFQFSSHSDSSFKVTEGIIETILFYRSS